jgi:hypothetical protein
MDAMPFFVCFLLIPFLKFSFNCSANIHQKSKNPNFVKIQKLKAIFSCFWTSKINSFKSLTKATYSIRENTYLAKITVKTYG